MRVLITGVAGFIGFHLAGRLAAAGYDVIGIDNINCYYSQDYKLARLKELGIITPDNILNCNYSVLNSRKFDNLKFYKGDIADSDIVERIFVDEKPDLVCNLAAQAGVRYSFENPLSYVHSNVTGFVTLLEAAKRHNVKDIVYASSSSVYGNNSAIPFSEDDITSSPESIYAATKKENELIANVYYSQFGFNMLGLRFFTVYGPWGRPDMAPFMFIRKIMRGESIRIFNNGDLSRDFSYISDIIEGVCKVIEDLRANRYNGLYEIYNIGRGEPVKLMDFVDTIERTVGKQAKKIMVEMQQGDVYTTYASTCKLEKRYGFKPSVTLNDGIAELFRWYEKYQTEFDKWGM